MDLSCTYGTINIQATSSKDHAYAHGYSKYIAMKPRTPTYLAVVRLFQKRYTLFSPYTTSKAKLSLPPKKKRREEEKQRRTITTR